MPELLNTRSPRSGFAKRAKLCLLLVVRSASFYAMTSVLLAGVILARWVASIGGVMTFRVSYGIVAPLVTVPIHVLLAITPFPSDAVAIANGALYGFLPGVGLNWLGWWVAALLEYGLGRCARQDFDFQAGVSRLPRWMQRFPVDHPVFLIGARQVPWLGGHITTFIPGVAGVDLGRYVWCSAVAVVPGSIVMAAIGTGLMKL